MIGLRRSYFHPSPQVLIGERAPYVQGFRDSFPSQDPNQNPFPQTFTFLSINLLNINSALSYKALTLIATLSPLGLSKYKATSFKQTVMVPSDDPIDVLSDISINVKTPYGTNSTLESVVPTEDVYIDSSVEFNNNNSSLFCKLTIQSVPVDLAISGIYYLI